MKFRQVALFALLFPGFAGITQEKTNAKFGNVTEKDFAPTVYSIDSNANAVVIADIGSSKIDGNNKGWFSLVFKQYKRVHILNKNGFDIANVSINLYTDGDDEEQLDKLKAVTYNLENGKVVETKLDVKANLFKDKIDKNRVIRKFTFPNIKAGSIIEYEYTVTSDFLQNLQPWEFQGDDPRIWSEYNLSLPEFLGYVFLTQGHKAYDIDDRKTGLASFKTRDTRSAGASEYYELNSQVTEYRWVMKNVPALKEEAYTSTVENHIAKIEFQLSELRSPLQYQNIMGSWQKLAEDLLKDGSFGDQLKKGNDWLNDVSGPLLKGTITKMEKARKIYAYVRDNLTCTNHSRWSMDQSLKNVLKTRNGNVAEINILLTAMLKHENIDADPILLSTRRHGYTLPLYPLLTKFNYVICRANIDGQVYNLDASEPRLGFGFLPLRCYNGHARVINPMAEAIQFTADSVMERKLTTIFIIEDDKGKLVGSMQQTPGYYESLELRNRIKEKGQEQLMKDISKAFGSEIEISNPKIDSLEKYDVPLGIKYDFDMKEEMGEILYLNPMFGEGYKENPFKSAERFYPVEMPFASDETLILQLEVPKGYVVDELPKQLLLKLNEQDDANFEYRITESGGNISLRSRLQFKRCNFLPEEYEVLREFFNMIVNKEAEQIVFKKKK